MCPAGELQPETLSDLPTELTIALEWTEAERSLAYRWAGTLRDPRLVHLTDDPTTALTLSLLTDRVFARPPDTRAFAKVHGNELICALRGPVDGPSCHALAVVATRDDPSTSPSGRQLRPRRTRVRHARSGEGAW